MVSLKYIDSHVKTFIRIGDGYIQTLKELRDTHKLYCDIAKIYGDVGMYEEAFHYLDEADYVYSVFESLIDQGSVE